MGGIEKLYSDEIVGEKLIPIVIRLCSDQVTSVRQSMAIEVAFFFFFFFFSYFFK